MVGDSPILIKYLITYQLSPKHNYLDSGKKQCILRFEQQILAEIVVTWLVLVLVQDNSRCKAAKILVYQEEKSTNYPATVPCYTWDKRSSWCDWISKCLQMMMDPLDHVLFCFTGVSFPHTKLRTRGTHHVIVISVQRYELLL